MLAAAARAGTCHTATTDDERSQARRIADPSRASRRCAKPYQISRTASAATATSADHERRGVPPGGRAATVHATALAAHRDREEALQPLHPLAGLRQPVAKRRDEARRAGTAAPSPSPSAANTSTDPAARQQQRGAERGAEERPGAGRRDEGRQRAGRRSCPPAARCRPAPEARTGRAGWR